MKHRGTREWIEAEPSVIVYKALANLIGVHAETLSFNYTLHVERRQSHHTTLV